MLYYFYHVYIEQTTLYCEFLFPLVIEVVGTKPISLSLEIPPLDEDEEVKAILHSPI